MISALLGSVMSAWTQPIITTQPQNQTNILGSNAVFSVVATGTGTWSYQWRSVVPGTGAYTNIVGAAESVLTLTQIQPTTRQVGVLVTDATGSTLSILVSLTVLVPHSITVQPTTQTAQNE